MNPRHPLTQKVARTARETRRDPHDWWEGPTEPCHFITYAGHLRPAWLLHSRRRRVKRSLLGRLVSYFLGSKA